MDSTNNTTANSHLYIIFGDVNLMGYVPAWISTVYIVVNVLIFVFGVAGNLVIMVIYHKSKQKTPCDWFILFIAYMDMIVCFCHPLFNLRMELQWEIIWDFHGIICMFESLINFSAMLSSCFLLGLMALERYIKVCSPTVAALSGDTAKLICYGCIALSAVLCFYPSYLHTTESHCITLEAQGQAMEVYMLCLFFIFCACFVIVIVSYANVIGTIETKIKVKQRLMYHNGLHSRGDEKVNHVVISKPETNFNCFNYFCKVCQTKKHNSENGKQSIKIEIIETDSKANVNTHIQSNNDESVKLSSMLENKLNHHGLDGGTKQLSVLDSQQSANLPAGGNSVLHDKTGDVFSSIDKSDHPILINHELETTSTGNDLNATEIMVRYGEGGVSTPEPCNGERQGSNDVVEEPKKLATFVESKHNATDASSLEMMGQEIRTTFTKKCENDDNMKNERQLSTQRIENKSPSPRNDVVERAGDDGNLRTNENGSFDNIIIVVENHKGTQIHSDDNGHEEEDDVFIEKETLVHRIVTSVSKKSDSQSTETNKDSIKSKYSSTQKDHLTLRQQPSLESYFMEEDLYSDIQPVSFFLRRAKEKMHNLQDKIVHKKTQLSTCSHRRKKWMKERRMTFMLFSITFVFLISWIPPWALYLFFLFGRKPFQSHMAVRMAYRYWEKMTLLQYCTNYIIYYTFNPGFRKKVKLLLPWMYVCRGRVCCENSDNVDVKDAQDV